MPSDTDPNTPIRLKDIIPIAFPHGGISVSSLRLESRRGRLTIIRLAGKDFTTLAHIEEMKRACVMAAEEPVPKVPHQAVARDPSVARDAAMMIALELRHGPSR